MAAAVAVALRRHIGWAKSVAVALFVPHHRIMKMVNGVEVSDRVAAQVAVAQARVEARRQDREVFRCRRAVGLAARHRRKLARPG